MATAGHHRKRAEPQMMILDPISLAVAIAFVNDRERDPVFITEAADGFDVAICAPALGAGVGKDDVIDRRKRRADRLELKAEDPGRGLREQMESEDCGRVDSASEG